MLLKYFCPSLSFIFYFLTVVFWKPEILKYQFFLLWFINYWVRNLSMRYLHDLRSQRLYPVFYCSCFIALDFSYICSSFDFLFVYGLYYGLRFSFVFEMDVLLFHAVCWKYDILSLLNCLCNFVENQLAMVLFLDYLVPLTYVSVLSPVLQSWLFHYL